MDQGAGGLIIAAADMVAQSMLKFKVRYPLLGKAVFGSLIVLEHPGVVPRHGPVVDQFLRLLIGLRQGGIA